MTAVNLDTCNDPMSGAMPSRKFLIVEDNKSDAQFVRRALRDLTNEDTPVFSEATRLKDAISLLANESFDLVILDLGLPDMEGVVVVAAIRATAPQTPIVVYSSSSAPEVRQEAILCGAHHYLVKNIEGPMRFKMFVQSVLMRTVQ